MMKNKKNQLNIAMLGHKRIPSREGGVEIVVEELATRMAKLGHQVTCYNRKGHHISGKEFDTKAVKEYKGVHIKTVPTIESKGLSASISSLIASIQTAFSRYDIVHFHAEGPCATLWLPKLFGKRCIATIHGLDHQRAKWGKFGRMYILTGEKMAVKYADEIIVLSKGMQKYFQDTYGRKTVFIPNGVNRPEIRKPDLIKKWNLQESGYILFLGRLVPEKGLKYLIEAFKDVKTEKRLVIAGGSSDTDEFSDECRKLAAEDERIIFTGFVQGKLLDELYSNAYIYVLPSDLEGMPLSLLEAMSYGNCCVVSDIDECREVVESHAVVFQKSNVEKLREALQMLCDHPEQVRKYRSEAADFICSKYNWDDVTEKTLALYAGEE